MNIFLPAYTLMFFFTALNVANAQTHNIGMSVTLNAEASIHDDNITSAREKALNSVLRGAIEDIMDSMIGAKYQDKFALLIERYIISNMFSYIIKYEILKENTIHERSYAVSVKVLIDSIKLEQDLDRIGVLQNRLSTPKIVLVVSERMTETNLMNEVRLSETIIRRELKNSGFFLVDSDIRLDNVQSNGIKYSYEGDITEAIAIGNKFGGDIVVFGISEVTLKEETGRINSKIKNILASIELKAIKLDNGILLSESSVLAVYPHSNPQTATERAIGKASVKVVKKLSDDIMSRWKTEVNAGRQVIVSVSNVKSYSQFNSFKNSLKYYLTSHVEVESRSFDGIRAEYSVTTSTTGYNMALELEGKKFEEFNFKILNSSLHALSVALVSQ